jgi:hypothetical protein
MQKSKQKGMNGYSLKSRFTIFFILFIVAVYSVVIMTAMWQIVTVTETLGIQMGLPIVEAAVKVIDGDSFEALSKSLDHQDPYYEKTRRDLLAIKRDSKAVYLYTMIPVEGGVFRYIIDGSGEPGIDEGFSDLGDEEDISSYIKPILKAMQTGSYQISTLDYSGEWGWLISVYQPIFNSSGGVVGIIGCDFVPADIFIRLWSQIIWELVIAGIFAVFGIVAYFYIVRGINRQNRHLVELKEAAEASSLALKEERDKVVIMKDRLLAEMRAFMELLQVKPEDFADFVTEAEIRFSQIGLSLKNPEILPEALDEICLCLLAIEEKARQSEMLTFADRLHEMAAKIRAVRESRTVSPADRAEIDGDLRKIMKAVNDARQIVKKIQTFRGGHTQVQVREEDAM